MNPRPNITHKPNVITIKRHPILDGTPCNEAGNDLEDGTPSLPRDDPPPDDYTPFPNRAYFKFAEFLYVDNEIEIYALIDKIKHGNVPWNSFSIKYNDPLPTDCPVPPWMTEEHEVWFQDPPDIFENQLGNPDFADKTDYALKRVYHKDK
ncbi:hypothetical protein DXG01_012132 [Tephrocybe rancida]|nr:hypothetical protein DXG01_012132 [Tephrocybe rancida]